jgi:hypothetical protein
MGSPEALSHKERGGMPENDPRKAGDPYCGNCGCDLLGLVDASKCPGCRRPLVEVLVREPRSTWKFRRYRSPISVFGLPLLHIALGPSQTEFRGHAKGIIAIGDTARGLFAFGGVAFGVIAMGGLAIGLVGFGGAAIGLLSAMGGAAGGGLAVGGGALGVVAQGGGAVGVIADGGGAYGYFARGDQAQGRFTISQGSSSPGAEDVLARWGWLIGEKPGRFALTIWALAAAVGVALFTAIAVYMVYVVDGSGRTLEVEPPP